MDRDNIRDFIMFEMLEEEEERERAKKNAPEEDEEEEKTFMKLGQKKEYNQSMPQNWGGYWIALMQVSVRRIWTCPDTDSIRSKAIWKIYGLLP